MALVVAEVAAGSAVAQRPAVKGPNKAPAVECTKRMTASDLKILLDDTKAKNPRMVERLNADPELRKKQTEDLRQLLAFACQAVKDGALNDPVNKSEMENLRVETVAAAFDKIANKGTDRPAFASISDDRVAQFYKVAGNEAQLDEFLKVKVALLIRKDPEFAKREVTADEKAQAREFFAKIRISDANSKIKARALDPSFATKTGLQVKLQQAQFLAGFYSDSNADKRRVTEAEISDIIKTHAEFNIPEKKAKAEGILARAKAGEDFAALANEFTEDPGNMGQDGKKQGGLYRDVPKGQMVPIFENAALALKPGELSPMLVESDFGYHIIKLERRSDVPQSGGTSELTYDVRHILISTMQKDPKDPTAQELPVREFVRKKLETQKEDEFIAKVVADNPVEVAAIPVTPPPVKKAPAKRRTVRRK